MKILEEVLHISLFATILFSASFVVMHFRLPTDKVETEIRDISLEQIDGEAEFPDPCTLSFVECNWKFTAPVTKYLWTGFRMANGEFPREGFLACPREFSLGSMFEINGKDYICGDRTAKKYNGRFDLFTEESYEEAIKFGKQNLVVVIK